MERHTVVARGHKAEIAGMAVSPGAQARPQPEVRVVEVSRSEVEHDGDRVLVELHGASVSYGNVAILDGVDWTVRAGERWALLGPNGAGKTTLLSLIVGDNPQAYANRIWLFGRRRGSGESIWEVKQQIGWVAPELHLYHPRRITTNDVVCSGFFDTVGLYRRPSPQQRHRATRWMENLGISELAGLPMDEISEGEQRLVLIARALVKEPLLLVLDEPCQGLDEQHRDMVVQTIEALGSTPDTSIIYVTHDRDALPRNLTHMLKLDQGRVVTRGRMDRNSLSAVWREPFVSGGNNHGR
jgi:molybdate transport system ATP-binding protein